MSLDATEASLPFTGTGGHTGGHPRARTLRPSAGVDRPALRVLSSQRLAVSAGGAGDATLARSHHDLLRLVARDGRAWELRPGQVLHLGTHPANDVIARVDDDEVQAQIQWASPDRAPLLSARRGWRRVRVDERAVLGAVPLRNGHVIALGDQTLLVELVRGLGLFQALPALEPIDLLVEPPPQEDDPRRPTARAWLRRVLAELETAERTGVLRLIIDGRVAEVRFDRGRVVDATCGELAGLAALEQVRTGDVRVSRFEPRAVVRPGPLDESIREFLRVGYWELARRRATRRRTGAGLRPA